MSDSVDDSAFRASQLLNKAKTRSLREQMRQFATDHRTESDFKTVREEVSDGRDLSAIVTRDRDERL